MEKTNDRPSAGFGDSVTLSVSIKASPDRLYKFLTDIENLSDFFPQVEFKLGSEGPLKVGSIYHTRQKGKENWSDYRVLFLEPGARMSAELTGKDPLFAAMRYDHRFMVDGSETISHEKIDYKFRFGIVGRILNLIIGKRLVRKQVLDAHVRLKEKAEKP